MNQVPAAFKKVNWERGTVNLDYGGGKYETATEYLAARGVTNLVYDPFNRDAQHNTNVLRQVTAQKADTGTVCNVLNVIKEPRYRQQVLKNVRSLVKSGGKVYISCYRGKDSEPGATSNGWQENRPLYTYVEEVTKAGYTHVALKDKMIVATV